MSVQRFDIAGVTDGLAQPLQVQSTQHNISIKFKEKLTCLHPPGLRLSTVANCLQKQSHCIG